MWRRLTRLSPLLVLLLSGEVLAVGLGEIQLNSALNEPLRAEIVLLSASPEELTELVVNLASAETFERYGIDRPFYLQEVEFKVELGGVAGSVVRIRSRSPITEPFLTFLVEATWPSGRLLREYTVLLDPPNYAPPSVQQTPVVTAPRRSTPSDSGRFTRQPPPPVEPQPELEYEPEYEPEPQPVQAVQVPEPAAETQAPEPMVEPAAEDDYAADYEAAADYETDYAADYEADVEPEVESVSASGGDYLVVRHDTLWGIASRMRSDSRLTMNQAMLAIFEENPDAFGGNINILRAGATLRIPGADDVFQISRGDALEEVQRQHAAWGGSSVYSAYVAPETTSQPSLTLVPPDEDPVGSDYDDYDSAIETLSREEQISNRIEELEAADVPDQHSLLEIRDNELASLRQQLADIRGEVYEPFVEEVDDILVDDGTAEFAVDDAAEEAADEPAQAVEEVADIIAIPTNIIISQPADGDSIVDQIIEFATGFWGMVVGALLLLIGALVWFMNRGDDDDDADQDRPWEALDSDAVDIDELSATKSMLAPTPDDAFIVVEQDSGEHPIMDETVEAPADAFSTEVLDVPADAFSTEVLDVPAEGDTPVETVVEEIGEAAQPAGSMEDTFSSETAVNLDQSDPIAEADFHMAYGLYDQAADLINGALETDPTDKALMSKLCEVYFVWGNRDAFVDAATKLNIAVGESGSADWDKIVIMGQQIAAEHKLFAGANVAGATKEVDLSLDEGDDDAPALDMDFGTAETAESDVLDLSFGETGENPVIESSTIEKTAVMQSRAPVDPFADVDAVTSELPSLDETLGLAIADSGEDSEATAEINLDELGLDVGDMAATEDSTLDDLDATGQNEALIDLADATGKNPQIDPNATGVMQGSSVESTSIGEGLDLDDLSDLSETGLRLAADETGQNPMFNAETEHDPSDLEVDSDLLDATGRTQVLGEDMAVDTATGFGDDLPDSNATLLAPLDDDDTEEEFDFAKTEALPADAFTDIVGLDETAETPAIAGTDVDLDLDDLTAALKVSELDDTIEQPRDDATVEHPRPQIPTSDTDVPTMALAPEDMSDDLHEARTMTEVGTKLDLARAYVDMGDPAGARGILEEVLDEGDEGQKQQAQKLLDSLPTQ